MSNLILKVSSLLPQSLSSDPSPASEELHTSAVKVASPRARISSLPVVNAGAWSLWD